ncbi:chemotaxis protein CheD [Parapusillimonas granuli]|uniref:Probable chemoreceptor glutamine deamidase CheD n=1 Tax=Parapusillimonas granuli TaxID=380911 RepID=A0A853FX75_9BURK|nr:chemotaxis protein CheD [Parapusillimonas granuli]MBB5213443.1 chemotaxis protein CheD [Parapusillimonas granuli]NYT48282.1 chemotaxis protein CheD [Parapusillimonas granuli]
MAADPQLLGRAGAHASRGVSADGAAGRNLERVARMINPGGWAVEDERPIATLLGSCVAVCLYDPKLRLAGMNHFLLPGGSRRHVNDDDTVLHGDYAMEVLRNAMFARGASEDRLVAKAFGGGNVVNAIHMAIGTRNAEFARQWLQREGIPLLADDMGGSWSRKVVLDPLTGDAFCRRGAVHQPEAISMANAENAYEKELLKRGAAPTAREKKIELF